MINNSELGDSLQSIKTLKLMKKNNQRKLEVNGDERKWRREMLHH